MPALEDLTPNGEKLGAVRDILKEVPVYQDAIQPGARQVGLALETVGKTLNVVLAPLKVMIWGYDRIIAYVEASLVERLKNVPPSRLVTPSATVAGPALEALRFAGSDPSLRELYANLLANSIDLATARDAHPGFVEIIKQLSPDEAKLLPILMNGKPHPTVSIHSNVKGQPGGVCVMRHFSLAAAEADCQHPDLVGSYLDNLVRLGLIDIPPGREYTTMGVYDPVENSPQVKATLAVVATGGRDAEIERLAIVVTNLGKQFHDACVTWRERK